MYIIQQLVPNSVTSQANVTAACSPQFVYRYKTTIGNIKMRSTLSLGTQLLAFLCISLVTADFVYRDFNETDGIHVRNIH